MNNIEQVRESISDASHALTQVGEDAPHLTLLVMQERLKRLVDLEYALLTGMGGTEKTMAQGVEKACLRGKVRTVDGLIKNVEYDRYAPHPYGDAWLTITMMDDTKRTYRFVE